MGAPSRTPFAAVAALVLLAATPACAPGTGFCSSQPDRSDRPDGNRGFTRENYVPVHPVMAVTAVAGTAACLLAGNRYN